jgi:phosphoserine aminotransferase
MGPAGVTVVIVRRDLLERSPETLPEIFSYKKVAQANSLLNTPPVFAIYMTGLVCQWVQEQGGVTVMQERSEQKAKLLYDCIDAHADFYIPNVQTDSRSHINVTFHLPSTELEKKFLSAADEAGFIGLKGHRVAGGVRISLYNAVELSHVQALVAFMQAFARL